MEGFMQIAIRCPAYVVTMRWGIHDERTCFGIFLYEVNG